MPKKSSSARNGLPSAGARWFLKPYRPVCELNSCFNVHQRVLNTFLITKRVRGGIRAHSVLSTHPHDAAVFTPLPRPGGVRNMVGKQGRADQELPDGGR